jgi:predicted RNase H-like HicB family nuclease
MKKSDQYHKRVEWSEEDGAYIGKCPDLITGIHGNDPKKVYADLCEVIEDVIAHFEAEGRPLPAPKVRPMQEVVWRRLSNKTPTEQASVSLALAGVRKKGQ